MQNQEGTLLPLFNSALVCISVPLICQYKSRSSSLSRGSGQQAQMQTATKCVCTQTAINLVETERKMEKFSENPQKKCHPNCTQGRRSENKDLVNKMWWSKDIWCTIIAICQFRDREDSNYAISERVCGCTIFHICP